MNIFQWKIEIFVINWNKERYDYLLATLLSNVQGVTQCNTASLWHGCMPGRMYHPTTLWTSASCFKTEWIPARLGKAWPGNDRVTIYLGYRHENDFLRYRISVYKEETISYNVTARYPAIIGHIECRLAASRYKKLQKLAMRYNWYFSCSRYTCIFQYVFILTFMKVHFKTFLSFFFFKKVIKIIF